MSTPIHPATVHFPIAFLSLHYALDLVYGLATTPVTTKLAWSLITTVTGQTTTTPQQRHDLSSIATASYYLNVLGFVTALPAVVSGGQQLVQMIAKQDLANKLAKSGDKLATARAMHPKMKLGFAHAAMNDVAVAAAGYVWYARRSVEGFAPSGADVLVSGVLLAVLFYSAHLGGRMTYEHGVAVKVAKKD